MTYYLLNKKIRKLGGKINVPENLYPLMKHGDLFSSEFIEIRFPFYYYVVLERGIEIKRKKFKKIDELLYYVFKNIISSMSIQYEKENFSSNKDIRRVSFPYQIELMTTINDKFGNRLKKDFDEILKKYPFQDIHVNQ